MFTMVQQDTDSPLSFFFLLLPAAVPRGSGAMAGSLAGAALSSAAGDCGLRAGGPDLADAVPREMAVGVYTACCTGSMQCTKCVRSHAFGTSPPTQETHYIQRGSLLLFRSP